MTTYIPTIIFDEPSDVDTLGVFNSKLLAMYALKDTVNGLLADDDLIYSEIQHITDEETDVTTVYKKDKGYFYSHKEVLFRYKLCVVNPENTISFNDVLDELKCVFRRNTA